MLKLKLIVVVSMLLLGAMSIVGCNKPEDKKTGDTKENVTKSNEDSSKKETSSNVESKSSSEEKPNEQAKGPEDTKAPEGKSADPKATETPSSIAKNPSGMSATTPVKSEPASNKDVVGTYTMVISKEQIKKMRDKLTEMKAQQKDNPRAQAMDIDKAVDEMTKSMEQMAISFQADGTVVSQMGSQKVTTATFKCNGNKITMTPTSSRIPGAPSTVTFTFNKKDKTLTAVEKGEKVVLKKK